MTPTTRRFINIGSATGLLLAVALIGWLFVNAREGVTVEQRTAIVEARPNESVVAVFRFHNPTLRAINLVGATRVL